MKGEWIIMYNPIVIDEKTKAFMETVCENGKVRLKNENDIECEDWKAINTIGIIWLEEIVRELGNQARANNNEVRVSIHQDITIGLDLRTEEDAEKEGNLNLVFIAGPKLKQLAKNDSLTESDD